MPDLDIRDGADGMQSEQKYEAVPARAAALAAPEAEIPDIPHRLDRLSAVRRTIARRLTQAKQHVPHIYLTVDVRLDAALAFRAEYNARAAADGISVNDMLVKALALALARVPQCNVMYTPGKLVTFERVDVSVAVSTPSGLIAPVVAGADTKPLGALAGELRALVAQARAGTLTPDQYRGGTASLSNMGMLGIKQFEAIINPPQAMILAVGAGEQRWMVEDGAPRIATVMTVTGSFDHRAIDGADGALLLQAFKAIVENPAQALR
ncbi:dihydrolipoamide acetyltransferase family protein [Sphingomonas flavalba]|uniref:dihydrolipoamide acetyltransferase family protein n=1 Tax=Sphingomonas flavalba TaxID=2559804 RepID=UPI0039DFD990